MNDPLPHATTLSHIAGHDAAERFLHHVKGSCPRGDELFFVLSHYRQPDPACEKEWLRGFSRRLQKALMVRR